MMSLANVDFAILRLTKLPVTVFTEFIPLQLPTKT